MVISLQRADFIVVRSKIE